MYNGKKGLIFKVKTKDGRRILLAVPDYQNLLESLFHLWDSGVAIKTVEIRRPTLLLKKDILEMLETQPYERAMGSLITLLNGAEAARLAGLQGAQRHAA